MTNQVETQAGEEQEPVQLSLQDISTFVQIIDICSKRGGFEGQEMEAIGGLRNRTVQFLNPDVTVDTGEDDAQLKDQPIAEVAPPYFINFIMKDLLWIAMKHHA